MKKFLRRFNIILLTTLVIMMAVNTVCNGSWLTDDDLNRKFSDKSIASDVTRSGLYTIISVTKIVGVAIGIIMLLAIAIRYMYSAPSDKAEIKKHAVVYIVGAVVLFATTGLLSIIQNFSTVIKL